MYVIIYRKGAEMRGLVLVHGSTLVEADGVSHTTTQRVFPTLEEAQAAKRLTGPPTADVKIYRLVEVDESGADL